MAMCRGKHQYAKRSLALKKMRAWGVPPKAGVRPNVYRCRECGWYHIGHDFLNLGGLPTEAPRAAS